MPACSSRGARVLTLGRMEQARAGNSRGLKPSACSHFDWATANRAIELAQQDIVTHSSGIRGGIAGHFHSRGYSRYPLFRKINPFSKEGSYDV